MNHVGVEVPQLKFWMKRAMKGDVKLEVVWVFVRRIGRLQGIAWIYVREVGQMLGKMIESQLEDAQVFVKPTERPLEVGHVFVRLIPNTDLKLEVVHVFERLIELHLCVLRRWNDFEMDWMNLNFSA